MRRLMIDANVMVSSWALDVIMCLADAHMLEPCWSEKVLEEFERAVSRIGRHDIAVRVARHLKEHYPDACVSDWEGHIQSIVLPDQDDRHVVAAALEGECGIIVTYNLRDFPRDVLQPLGLRVLSPDDLLMELVHEAPVRVLLVIEELIDSKSRPPRTYDQEVEGLRRCGLKRFAEWLDS